ncbi:MAG: Ig-like domain-containing protein, partial [Bacteroidales bacterium]
MKRKHLSIVLASLLALVAGLSSCTKEIPVTGITIEQENLTLQVGSSAQLTISISPLDATHKEATYSSRNESIATVTENGTVTGIAVGETWVLASTIEGGFRDSCAILVEPASGSTVVLSGNLTDDITLKSDIRYLLDGWVYVKDGATMTIEPGTVIQGKTGSKASL